MNVTKSLLVDRQPTLGLLDLHAEQGLLKHTTPLDHQLDFLASPIARMDKWETSLIDLRKMHVMLYNLLGDPATRIPLPAAKITELKLNDGVITGQIKEMKSGRVTITIQTARTAFTQPEKLQPAIGDNDPDLEVKSANNYPLVNIRTLQTLQGEVVNGRFTIPLPLRGEGRVRGDAHADEETSNLPPTASIIRARAVGTIENGNPIDAIGAMRLPTATSPPPSP